MFDLIYEGWSFKDSIDYIWDFSYIYWAKNPANLRGTTTFSSNNISKGNTIRTDHLVGDY